MSVYSYLLRIGLKINKLSLIPPPVRKLLQKFENHRRYNQRKKYFTILRRGISPDTSIFCNNCFGARISQDLGYAYNSPCVGLKFPENDYQVFLENLQWVEKAELHFRKHSKYEWFNEYDQNYPIGYITVNGNDVEIWFVHYKTNQEAYDKWKRRCKRINWNDIVIIETNYTDSSKDNVESFFKLPYHRTVYLSNKQFDSKHDNYMFVDKLCQYSSMAPYAEAHILYEYLSKVNWLSQPKDNNHKNK